MLQKSGTIVGCENTDACGTPIASLTFVRSRLPWESPVIRARGSSAACLIRYEFRRKSPTREGEDPEFLREKSKTRRGEGYAPRREHVVIEGTPVQFIPAYNALVEEAVTHARAIRFKHTRTRLLRVEHLLAIMLQTGRPKDRARMVQLLEEAKISQRDLDLILERHGLRPRWRDFRKRFYDT